MSYTGDERIDRLIDWCKVFTSKTEEEIEESSKRVLSKTSASKLVSEVKRLSGDDEIMMEFDLNSKRDLERKSEYDEMVSKFEKKYQELENKIEIERKNKQIEIARNLLDLNMSVDDIKKATGLSKEEIEKIKKL